MDMIFTTLLARRGGRGGGRLLEALAEQYGFWPAVGLVVGAIVLITIASHFLKSGQKSQASAEEAEHHEQPAVPPLPPLPSREGPPRFNG